MTTATQLPEQFGRYRILQLLGKGGMGAVYLAEDGQLGRNVAVKVPHFTAEDGPDVIERFYREARVAASIEHPNICGVYDVGQIDGIHYLTMPVIHGTKLSREFNANEPWPSQRAAALVVRLASALYVMHQRGIMHRDLKPDNILLRAGEDPVIMDFGLARSVSHTDRMTGTGALLGTPVYMSPEQVRGDPRAIGSSTDIYTLGVILYELVTGQLPFPGPGGEVFGQILRDKLRPPSQLFREVGREIDAICLKAMAREPGERYATMAEMAAALQIYLNSRKPVVADKPASVYSPSAVSPPEAGAEGMVKVVCSTCGKRLRVPASSSGKKVRCPKCQNRVDMAPARTLTASPRPNLINAPLTPTPPPQSSDTERRDQRLPERRYGRPLLVGGLGTLALALLVIWLWPGGRPDKNGTPSSQSSDSLPKEGGKLIGENRKGLPPVVKNDDKPAPPVHKDGGKEVAKQNNQEPKPAVAPPGPLPGPIVPKEFTNKIDMLMVPIAAGNFQMGSFEKTVDSSSFDDERPRHEVTIRRPFYMAAHKVTQAQFAKVVGRKPSYFSATGGGKEKVAGIDTEEKRYPVETVSYFDAIEFCIALSKQDGLKPCYELSGATEVKLLPDGTGYRLPTEAEWEYCARAGKPTSRYWFGDDESKLGEYAWFTGNSESRTHPVGEKKANRWGLYDMGGLLYEWCEDYWHEDYQGAPDDGSAWRSGGDANRRVVRGGSWYVDAGGCRSADRYGVVAGYRGDSLGFRVVLVSP